MIPLGFAFSLRPRTPGDWFYLVTLIFAGACVVVAWHHLEFYAAVE